MDQRRAAAALLALAACFACSTAAPTSNNQTALDLYDAPVEGCYYNFQHYSEGDRIMTNEPCLNCTCHNRMLMCYLRVCPFTKPIGQDCTVEKRADQCCPIVTCPDVPVDLLTSTSTSSPAEYGATGLGKLDRFGCSINGKYFPEGSKVPPAPNKPCEHCYCIRNMTTCVMQECTLHVDGCTPIYHKDVCCPIRYSCDHSEDEIPLLDDMTTTVRPTPGFLLTTTTMMPVTQPTQDCVHDDQIFPDGALIKTEKACEHCYCMKGDIVCVVQECGTPMENEGKNCTSLPPRQGQCCPDTYICEGDETQTTSPYEEITTLSPPRRVGVEGSGYRNEPDEPYTEVPSIDSEIEGSGEDQPMTTVESSELLTSPKYTPESTTEYVYQYSTEPDKGLNTVPDVEQGTKESTIVPLATVEPERSTLIDHKSTSTPEYTTVKESTTNRQDETTYSGETSTSDELAKSTFAEVTTKSNVAVSTSDNMTPFDEGFILATKLPEKSDGTDSNFEEEYTTIKPSDIEESSLDNTNEQTTVKNILSHDDSTVTTEKMSETGTTSIDIQENEIYEDLTPGRIPGEGDCLLNSITYKNNSIVPSTSKCHSSCKCVSSIVKCEPIICTPPLEYMENMNDCHPVYDSPESCCPTYVCNTKETIAPESHSQMSGTESPKPTIECAGDECKIVQESKPTEGHIDKIDCGETGCPETAVTQKDLEGCINDKCDSPQYPITETKPCDSDSGCQAPVIKPCDTDNCETKLELPIHDGKEDKPIDTIQPNDGDQEILCKEENCRRKEHSDIGQDIPCKGENCLPDDMTIPNIGNDITTQKIEADKSITKADEYVTQHPEEITIPESGSTMKLETSQTGEIYPESTSTAGLYSEKQTTPSDVPEQNYESSHQGETITPSVPTSDISTEHFEPTVSKQEDQTTKTTVIDDHKINIPSLENDLIDEHNAVVTESYEIEKQTTAQVTEKESVKYTTISDELSTISEAVKVTSSKEETETPEFTKEITTESLIAPETTKDDTTLKPSEESEMLDHSQVTQIFDYVTPSILDDKTTIEVMLEEKTSTSVPKLVTTNRDEIITQNVNIATEKETVYETQTDKSHDEAFHEVTERVETTSMKYTDSESGSRVTFSDTTSYDTQAQNIDDKESPQVLETSTLPIDMPKEDEKHEYSSGHEDSTSITDKTIEYSTPAHEDKDMENVDVYDKITTVNEPFVTPDGKDFENQKEHETVSTISTELPEQFTQEDIKTTPSIQDNTNQYSDTKTTKEEEIYTTPSNQYDKKQESNSYDLTKDTDMITQAPEAHSVEPTYVNTDSTLDISPKETGTSENMDTVTKPTLLDQDSSEKTNEDDLEQHTTLSTIQSSMKVEKIDTFTELPEDIVTNEIDISNEATTVGLITDSKHEQTEVPVNAEETTKAPESTHSVDTEFKPSSGTDHDESDTESTVAYNDYEPTKEVVISEIPVVLEQSTPSVDNTANVEDTIVTSTVIPEDELKTEFIMTDNLGMSTEGGIKIETAASSEKPKLEYTLAEEVTESMTNMPVTDLPYTTIGSHKPVSTDSDLSQEMYSSTTTKNNEISESTEQVDHSITEEIVSEKMPDTPKLDDSEKVTVISGESNPTTSAYKDSENEKTVSNEIEYSITTESHDLRYTPETISSTTSSKDEAVTDQKIEVITDITHEKDKETEAPMSLVTDSQSISTLHETVTESVQKVTNIESNVDEQTEPQIDHKKTFPDTTLLEESITTQQSDIVDKEISHQSTTEYKYPAPSTESSGIITTEVELSTAKLITTTPQIPTETPLLMNTEQELEKETVEMTHEIKDIFISTTTEKLIQEYETTQKVHETTKEIESSTEFDNVNVEREGAPSTEQSIPNKSEQETHDTPAYESATESHEIKDVTSAIEETTKYPQYFTTLTAEEVSKETEEELHHTTESSLELTTQPQVDKEQATITVEAATTIKPDVIYSTISSDNESPGVFEISTKAPESVSDSTGTVDSISDKQTTVMNNLVNDNVLPDDSKTEIYQETQTKEPSTFEDDKATIPEEEMHVDKSDKTSTTESDLLEKQTIPGEEFVTKYISDESTILDNTESKPTLVGTMTTSAVNIPDTKVTGLETTTETKNKFSETTPYFVELEEHTHQIVEETTVIPVGEVSTVETTDIKSTERGDQMFTEIPYETEKSSEETSELSETHSTTSPIIDETTEQKYQTTAPGSQLEITTISALLSQKETTSDEKPLDLDEKTTISPVPNIMQNEERVTVIPEETEKPTSYFDLNIPVTTSKYQDLSDIPVETKIPDEDSRTTKHPTSEIAYERTTVTPVITSTPDDAYKSTSSVTTKPITAKPMLPSDLQPTEEVPTPEFPQTGYDQEPDYGEEDQAFGPGTCRYGGKVYVSAQQIPRDDPCDFCFCFRSDIICLQQSCPPPIHGCHEEPIQGFCCPRYECPVSMATTVNVTTTTTTTTTTLPPHFLPHAYKGTAQRKGCHIQGRTYKVGEVVRASSGPCLHCTCGGDGQMKCDPKACTPEPMLRQMIAAAVSARRRR
ncbi:unnamed protein product [Colias eurytheme]|nr:unnamed protein product [Colias eurytheme]